MRFICKVARITFCDDVARSSATLEEPGVEARSGGSSFEGIQDPGLIQNSLGDYISQLNWDPWGIWRKLAGIEIVAVLLCFHDPE